MRKKAFYSDQEIIKNLYTTGKEWMLNDYTEYVGQYHRYTTGEVYTQPVWNQLLSEQLVAYQELTQDIKTYKSLKSISTSYENNIKSYKPIISQDAKKSGSIIRYFIKRYDSENVIEISADTYNQYTRNQIDNNIYQTTSIEWIVSDTYSKIDFNAEPSMQIQQFNKKTIYDLSQPWVVLRNYLTNYLELYIDTTITVPKDINSK
jgi:hypothetical protein